MAFGSPLKLCRLLLRRSDRHPIGLIDGNDLAGVESADVTRFLRQGFLIEREPLKDTDGFVFQRIDDHLVAANVDGDGATSFASNLAIRQFDIGFEEICRAMRAGADLQGPAVHTIAPSTYWVGARGGGGRRVEYYIARVLRPQNAIDRAFALKARAGGKPIVILTPTDRGLPGDVLRQLAAERIDLVSIEEALVPEASEPFQIELPTMVTTPKEASAGFSIDTAGRSAKFQGQELGLARREFEVLVLLANERVNEDGHVSRDRVAAALAAAVRTGERNDEQIEKVISNVRAALRQAGAAHPTDKLHPIKNRRGMGYQLLIPREQIGIF
jgi:DNA-binding response OmpR family regulator